MFAPRTAIRRTKPKGCREDRLRHPVGQASSQTEKPSEFKSLIDLKI
jgi:hypothetical protein